MTEQTGDSRQRIILILAALFFGGAVPIQLVTLSFGYAQYVKEVSLGPKVIMTAHQFADVYVPFIFIPSLIILAAIMWHTRTHHPDIYRRIVVGLFAGALATVALDFFRQMGVIHSWLPGDTPVMFGKMATGSSDFNVYYPVGFAIHFLNGANFGLVYAFVWGRRKNYQMAIFWAMVWALILELGMMTLPPMAPMVGTFGVRFAWPQLFLLTLAAHIAFGLVLGLTTQFLFKKEDESWLIPWLFRSPT